MNYDSFVLEVQRQIVGHLPEQYQDVEVFANKVKKNNDTELTALVLHKPGETISPQLYLEQPFEEYKNGMTLNEIVEQLADSYLQSRNIEIPDVTELVFDFEKVQGLLRLQLINKAYNSEKLQDIPCKDLENSDLTAVLRIHLPVKQSGETTILVTDSMLSQWNKAMDELYPIALQNTMAANPARINSMRQIIMEMYTEAHGGNAVDNEVGNYKIEPYEQYVLSNSSRINGATVLLYPDILEQLAQGTNANLFLLPSSVHEIILMQDTGQLDAKELQAMVMTVNETDVLPEERLSDEVYYYDKDEHRLSMATSREATAEMKNRLMQTGSIEREHDTEMEMEEQ